MYAEDIEHVNGKRYHYLSGRLTIKGKAPACIHDFFFRLLRHSAVKFIPLCKLFFPAPDYKPPPNNSASMNTIRF